MGDKACTNGVAVAIVEGANNKKNNQLLGGTPNPFFHSAFTEELTKEEEVEMGKRGSIQQPLDIIRKKGSGDSRRTVTLLGEVEVIDRGVAKRIKYGEIGVAFNAAVGLALYVINSIVYRSQNVNLFVGVAIFSIFMFISLMLIYYKNLSFAIARRLLKEINVVVILGCGLSIFIIDCTTSYNVFSPFLSFIFLFETILFVFLDALKKKSRKFVLSVGLLFVLLNTYNIFQLVFGSWHLNTVLFRYGSNETFYILKRPIKRSIFFQITIFSFHGVRTMLKDTKMELLMFATGNIYRKTGTDFKELKKDKEEENKSGREKVAIRSSITLLGKDEVIDEHLVTRIKWGQRGTSIFGLIGMIIYIIHYSIPEETQNNPNVFLTVLVFIFAGLMFLCLGIIYYKNISFSMAKRLLTEVNVIAILFLGFCNFLIDIFVPYNNFSWVMSLIYLLEITLFLFLDAIRKKHRVFVLSVGILFGILNIYNASELIFGNYYVGVVLFQYGSEHVFYRRSVQRSIFIQIFMFSFKGLKIMFQDKEMDLLMFATGNIYRKTGTSSKFVEHASFVKRIESERRISSEVQGDSGDGLRFQI